MMLVADDFKNAMMSATEGQTKADVALLALGNAIADYILNNAEIDFSWHGQMINPAPPPPFLDDPVTTAKGGIVVLSISLTPSLKDNSSEALSFMANEISLGMKAGSFNITDPGFSTTPGTMSDCLDLSLSLSGETSRDAAFSNLANQILNWIKSYTPSAIILGSHGTFSAPPGSGGQAVSAFY